MTERFVAPSQGVEPAEIDWEAATRTPEFQALVRERGRFVTMAVVIGLGWMSLFVVLIVWAEGFMGRSIYEGFTVAYAMGLSQYLVTWVLTWLYLRKSRLEWKALERRAAERVMGTERAAGPLPTPGAVPVGGGER